MVGWREEEANQFPEVLAGKGRVSRGKEVTGRPPEVFASEGGGDERKKDADFLLEILTGRGLDGWAAAVFIFAALCRHPTL